MDECANGLRWDKAPAAIATGAGEILGVDDRAGLKPEAHAWALRRVYELTHAHCVGSADPTYELLTRPTNYDA